MTGNDEQPSTEVGGGARVAARFDDVNGVRWTETILLEIRSRAKSMLKFEKLL